MLVDWRQRYIDAMYGISHDLGAPLRHIESFADLLLDDPMTDEQHKMLSHIRDAGAQARAQMAGLLKLSRLYSEHAAQADEQTELSWAELVQGLQQMGFAAPSFAAPSWQFRVNLGHLISVLRELIANAERFGGGALTAIDRDEARLTLLVCNASGGLSDDQWHRALRPLDRLGKLSSTEHPGMGLTLTAAWCELQGITLRHRGGEVALDIHPQN